MKQQTKGESEDGENVNVFFISTYWYNLSKELSSNYPYHKIQIKRPFNNNSGLYSIWFKISQETSTFKI